MLEYLRGKATDRKLRLFAVACCRTVGPLVTDRASRGAMEAAEQYCEGLGSREDLSAAKKAAKRAVPQASRDFRPAEQAAAVAAEGAVDPDPDEAARLACGWARNVKLALAYEGLPGPPGAVGQTMADLRRIRDEVFVRWEADSATLLRDIFGNPFRPAAVDQSCLTPGIVQVAQAIYDERVMPSGTFDPASVNILADALVEAGCTDAQILGHCRWPGQHVRGCWVVDLVLGKK
jgi:hypothetical protein